MVTLQALVILLVGTLVSVAQIQAPPLVPTSVTSVVAKYKDDACFKSVLQPDASTLASTLCPPASCAAKIDEVITTYINSNDNYHARYGHILSFNRDMACYVPKPTNTSREGNSPCPPSSYLRVSVDSMVELRRSAPMPTACDPSTCANKYLVQWNAWVKSLPDDFLNNMPAGNLLDKVDIKSAALTLEQDIVAMCKDTKFSVGGLAAQLEVDKLPRKPAPKYNSAISIKGMGRRELAVVVLTWVPVLAVMYYTAMIG